MRSGTEAAGRGLGWVGRMERPRVPRAGFDTYAMADSTLGPVGSPRPAAFLADPVAQRRYGLRSRSRSSRARSLRLSSRIWISERTVTKRAKKPMTMKAA
jgi:hypothetical protein